MGELDFRRAKARPMGPRPIGLIALLAIVAGALWLRDAWKPERPGPVVEVVGDVPSPGWHVVRPLTVAAAVEAAGGDADGLPDTPLHQGDKVVVTRDGVHVAPSGDPLLVALPVDLNTAGAGAIAAIPGLDLERAERIVADRDQNGPFYDVGDLARVEGIGSETAEQARPFATVGAVGPRPKVRLSTASASQLEALPGIGPVTAARIVVDREENGPYETLDDLKRVEGVGDALVDKLDGIVEP